MRLPTRHVSKHPYAIITTKARGWPQIGNQIDEWGEFQQQPDFRFKQRDIADHKRRYLINSNEAGKQLTLLIWHLRGGLHGRAS
jgi:hypothetical protein